MIKFLNDSDAEPYVRLRDEYKKAKIHNQKLIEAISISSFDSSYKTVDSRFVNLKYIDKQEFIFFTNYDSPKSKQFEIHNQISAILFWAATSVQIRFKAKIKRTSKSYNRAYFKKRSIYKNALAISSNQSMPIASYDKVISSYETVKDNNNLFQCPDYWGGFSFKPYEIEFWSGRENRLNERDLYQKIQGEWHHSILQP
jgi:pyridoxamine 5'-phosphate oxidase